MRVIIQLHHSLELHAAAFNVMSLDELPHTVGKQISGFVLDSTFPAVQIPAPLPMIPGGSPFSLAQPLSFSFEPQQSTYLVRGEIPDAPAGRSQALGAAYANSNVVGVFADPVIESCPICPGDPPLGSESDVAGLLSVSDLARDGMDGAGVFLAVVDTGINLPYLVQQGRSPRLDTKNSWTPTGVTTSAGEHPVKHGTMCAYDAGIAAPQATLLDYAVLLSKKTGESSMSGLLSDAILAYSRLLALLDGMPTRSRTMVVSNSWGMFSPKWDFSVGLPGNYIDKFAIPFNSLVED